MDLQDSDSPFVSAYINIPQNYRNFFVYIQRFEHLEDS